MNYEHSTNINIYKQNVIFMVVSLITGTMKLISMESGNFKLDGGAMFGVVPKSLWQKVYPADQNNMCNLSLRLLYVEDEGRKILIDTGLGQKQDEKFFSYYYLNGDDSLEKSLYTAGIKKSDITDVILTHLHFDHCGGAVESFHGSKEYQTTFPNATYWCSNDQWLWSQKPNQREKASFLKENILPLSESGQLRFFNDNTGITSNIRIRLFHGHTVGLAVPVVKYYDRTIVYISDLIPTAAHVPLSWICGYDVQPLVTFREKQQFLTEALNNDYILFFEHDLYTVCCTLENTEKGIRVKYKAKSLDEMLSSSQ